MGFTHNWTRPKRLPTKPFRAAAEGCRKVVEHLAREHGLALQYERDNPDAPLFAARAVRFNGAGPAGHDTFFVPREDPDKGGFCKTERKPYDVAVCACLVVFDHHFPGKFLVWSDGEDADDGWARARAACSAVLGYGADFELMARDDFGRMEAAGLPWRKDPADRGLTHLANGWAIQRDDRPVYADPRRQDTRRPKYGVYATPHAFTDDQPVCRADTLAAARESRRSLG